MKDPNLDNALARLAANSPQPPANLEVNVWRSIRERREISRRESVFDWMFATIFRPAGVASLVAVTFAVAISIGSLEAADTSASTRSSLGLAVFASDAPTLPSTLMTHSR